jgi:hypothetical protein
VIPSAFIQALQPLGGVWEGTFTIDDESGFDMSMPARITTRFLLNGGALETEIVLTESEGTEVKSVALYCWDADAPQVVRFSANQLGEVSVFRGSLPPQLPPVWTLNGKRTTTKGTRTCDLGITFPTQDLLRMDYCWTDEAGNILKGHIEAQHADVSEPR